MSAIAGRVLIIPRGAYNSATEYHLLDQVFYQGSSYILKVATSTGNPPTDPDYWQISAQGAQDGAAGAFFGTCNTQAAEQNKLVTVANEDNFELRKGVIIGVRFTYSNTYEASNANPISLNVNSSGLYNVNFGGSATPTGTNVVAFGEAGFTNYYQYDGTYWVYIGRSGVQTAKQTPFDNTGTDIVATNTADALKEINNRAEFLVDDTTGDTYKLGIDNALLYYEEVV